jgi:hypothetical protein
MTSGIPDEDLFDAVRIASAALQRADWQQMQPNAVAHLVLQEAGEYLLEAVWRNQRDTEEARQQRAHDAIAARNRALEADRPPFVGQPLPDHIRRGWREALGKPAAEQAGMS